MLEDKSEPPLSLHRPFNLKCHKSNSCEIDRDMIARHKKVYREIGSELKIMKSLVQTNDAVLSLASVVAERACVLVFSTLSAASHKF